jgi:MYXO-CTERM domain-containing protein
MTHRSPLPRLVLLSPALLVGLWSTAAGAYPAYVRSNVGQPWGVSTNEAAMDAVFGGGSWDDLRFETVDPDTLFSGFYHFIYLEGSDSNAQELDAFLMANQDALETWVGSGGTLFLNAAPNEGGNMNWGFGGVTLTYPNPAGSGSAADGTHPIWNGPFLPCATAFTGNSYAHASINGVGLNPLILSDDGGDPNLAEMPFGGGTVIFGGLTTDNFWSPQPDAANLRANIIAYLEAGAQSGPCHNGVLDEGEECDDGNFVNTDDCVGQCVIATCGDHYVHAGVELCDDGDLDQTDACLIGCIPASCGDGFVQAGVEPCDDGNDGDATDECIDGCVAAICGDGFLWAGVETCDDGNFDTTDDCPLSCEPAVCGDGYVLAGVEPCDDGNASDDDVCLVGCIEAVCGDGHVNAGVEACDDGNTDDTDICVGTECQLAACGDGFLHTGIEDCDDGNDIDGDGCTNCNVDQGGESSTGGAESSTGSAEGSSTGGGESSTGGAESSTGGEGTTAADTSGGSNATTGTPGSSEGGGSSEDSSDSGGTTPGGDGCQCNGSGGGAAGVLPLLGAVALRRRRRRS